MGQFPFVFFFRVAGGRQRCTKGWQGYAIYASTIHAGLMAFCIKVDVFFWLRSHVFFQLYIGSSRTVTLPSV